MKPQMNTEQPGRNQRKSHHEDTKTRRNPLRFSASSRWTGCLRSQGRPPRSQRLCGEVRSSGFSLLRAQVSLEAEI